MSRHADPTSDRAATHDKRRRRSTAFSIAALVAGLVLLALTLRWTDIGSVRELIGRVAGWTLVAALVPSLLWHLLRTAAWFQCLPVQTRPSFARLFRVRLAAEAFSYVTIRGVAGEPLKVVLLAPGVAPETAAATVAVERLAYISVTALIVSLGGIVAIAALPLSPAWTRIFAVSAIVSAGVMLIPFALAEWTGRRRAQHSGVADPDGERSFVRRAVHALGIQLQALAHEDQRRLRTLVAIESAAFVAMALEVWIALRIVGVPASIVSAFAVETFSRTASVVSAAIPGNLGALEASNVAVVNAIHVSAIGALSVAVVRRLRGLFWCAAGFAIYPRPGRTADAVIEDRGVERPERTRVLVERDDSAIGPTAILGGLPIAERVVRQAVRDRVTRLLVWTPRHAGVWREVAARFGGQLRVEPVADAGEWAHALDALDADAQVALVAPATEDDLREAERQLRLSVFKPTDGRLGRFNRRMSLPVSVALIRWLRLSPHAMSVVVMVLGFAAGWLFSIGRYTTDVLAASVSLAASILDGCDGELARLQYKESAFGCWLDTLGDYTYYFAIFAGLTVGAVRETGWTGFWWIGGALLVGTLVTVWLLVLLRQRITGTRPELLRTRAKAHFDATGKRWAVVVAELSTCATRATAPYGILALAVLGLAPAVVVLGAIGAQIYWVSLAAEWRRLLAAHGAAPMYERGTGAPAG
jgi:uncharacterized protein (TIRG00374 family)